MLLISPATEILYVNQEAIQNIKWQKQANSKYNEYNQMEFWNNKRIH